MKCLNCGTEMTTIQVKTKKDFISYNICEKDGSLWLDAGELDKLAFQVQGSIEYSSQLKDAEPETQVRKCPRCDDFNLDRVRFLNNTDILLHHCRNCGGFWLDGGELDLVDKELAKIMPVTGKGFSDFVNNVHVPYWYQRVKKKSSETDFHVETAPIVGASLVSSTTDVCPADKNNLNEYKIFSMVFEGCPVCKGIWLYRDELRKLKNNIEHGSLRWLNDEIENLDKTSAIVTKRFCVDDENVNLISAVFGKSNVVIDWCPQCHGMWLDGGTFDSVTAYLEDELHSMHHQEVEHKAVEEIKKIWSGGPESRFEEARDVRATVSALVNTTIFEHPALVDFLMHLPRL
jgi:Zn-finger nucleic acid-binding protein